MSEVSVVIPTYRRLENLERILEAWLLQSSDVWLCDSSGKFETALPINHVRFSPDPGNKARHAVALMTTGDYVIKADDDVLPKPGLIDAFRKHHRLHGVLGLMGRTFHGKSYYENTKDFRANKIDKVTRVDMVGILTFSPRRYLAFDLKGCATPVEDLFWHMRTYPRVAKYVIPTTRYEQLPESKDEGCLYRDAPSRVEREKFYSKYYKKHYMKKRGRRR